MISTSDDDASSSVKERCPYDGRNELLRRLDPDSNVKILKSLKIISSPEVSVKFIIAKKF